VYIDVRGVAYKTESLNHKCKVTELYLLNELGSQAFFAVE